MCNVEQLECTWPSEMVDVEFRTLAINDDFIFDGSDFLKKDEMCAESINGEKLFDCCEFVTVEKK